MISFRRIYYYHLNNGLPGSGCKNVWERRMNWLKYLQSQTCTYTKKSTEEKLGIEKPKRPLNPFFKFMIQIRPSLNEKIPGISTKEAVVWSSKHWQQLDCETKSQMTSEYKKDLEDYSKKMTIYKASLTEKQKEDIKRLNEEITVNKEKRKLKSEFKQLGKPKKPLSTYLLYAKSRNDVIRNNELKEYHEKIKAGWIKLPEKERAMLDAQAKDLMKKYKKDIEAWELKMISLGYSHLVNQKPQKKKKPKKVKST